MFGIFFGLSLTAGSGLFHEQPYHACDRLHRLLPVPLEIPVSYPVPSLCHPSGHKCSQNVPGTEHLDLASLLLWSALYAVFAAIGTVIAGLLHIVFRKINY